jgi:hypothetical protein
VWRKNQGLFVISVIMPSIWNVFIKFRWHDEKLIGGTKASIKCQRSWSKTLSTNELVAWIWCQIIHRGFEWSLTFLWFNFKIRIFLTDKWAFHPISVTWFFGFFFATKLPKYYEIVCLLSLLCKARQTKRNSRNQNDAKTRNEATKISNELGSKRLKRLKQLILINRFPGRWLRRKE